MKIENWTKLKPNYLFGSIQTNLVQFKMGRGQTKLYIDIFVHNRTKPN